jgi:RNA polymerase sigma factor (sigma-70 family)
MPDANDMDLVREFARHHSDAAFTELVRRHLNLVYSVARRCTGNDGDAHDVAQAVFIILARKAAGLREKTLLTGWLYETTRFAAARLLRTNARRHAREQEAYMQSTLNEADKDLSRHSAATAEAAEIWTQLSPHLEAAMGKLNAADRALLVLRFYENKSGPEAAALLGIREDAAHKRVARALEKLRKIFAQRGVTLTATAIAGAVSANSVQAAPVALAKTVTAVAIVKGSIAAASTLSLVKGTMHLMTWVKLKFPVGIGLAVLLTAVPIMTIYHNEKAEYEVDGELTLQLLGQNNTITSEEHESFTVSIKNGKWFIVTKPQPGKNSANITRYEAGGDGKTFYQVAYYDQKTLDPRSLNSAIGLIENDAVPENIAGNHISELWLALASSSYLNNSKNGMIEPVYYLIDPSMRNEGWVEKASWNRFHDPPHLPQQVIYLNKNIVGMNGSRRVVIQPPPPFEKGFTRAIYNVEEATNIDGLTLPIRFSFKELFLNPTVTPVELETNFNIIGNVTTVRTVCERTNFIPEPTEATYVDDRRFARAPKPVEALAYMVTNNVWPATNVQWLQKSYQDELKSVSPVLLTEKSHPPAYKHLFVYTLIFFCSLASAALFFRCRKK